MARFGRRATGGLDDSVIDYTQERSGQRYQVSGILSPCLGQGHPQSLGGLRAAGIIRRSAKTRCSRIFPGIKLLANI